MYRMYTIVQNIPKIYIFIHWNISWQWSNTTFFLFLKVLQKSPIKLGWLKWHVYFFIIEFLSNDSHHICDRTSLEESLVWDLVPQSFSISFGGVLCIGLLSLLNYFVIVSDLSKDVLVAKSALICFESDTSSDMLTQVMGIKCVFHTLIHRLWTFYFTYITWVSIQHLDNIFL